jgi:4-alpha-glucanotransferase
MKIPRCSGVLLHITSLPGPWGIGDLGPQAYEFADFLAGAGQKVWQVLPLRPTGYGDSPYQCLSAFAGNPLLISLDRLIEEGNLSRDDLGGLPDFPHGQVDFEQVLPFKMALLRRAFQNYRRHAPDELREQFGAFRLQYSDWLNDFALFMAVKQAHQGRQWTEWEQQIAQRKPDAMRAWREDQAEEIAFFQFLQFLFRRQWDDLRRYCREREIRMMGDVPIFVAYDSAEVWARPDLFQLDELGRATAVAGVPPDYFSETGQLWGNPLYRWDVMAQEGFKWWVDRLRSEFSLVDVLRLDHFRGFEAYWSVPADEETAINGEWVPGPGAALFEKLFEELGPVPIVAENLGVITPEVESLREQFGLPGMAILQFAFGSDMKANDFQPHRFPRNLAVYTGTHDNDTIQGWWQSEGTQDSTRSPEDVQREKDFARLYLDLDGNRPVHWVFIRAVLSSVADLAVIPVQDLLGLGSESRMNRPGHGEGNWRWRLSPGQLTEELQQRLREMTRIYGRSEDPW